MMSAAHSAEAALIITEAMERFRNSVSSEDRGQIEGTELKDVVNALLRIQQDLQQRRENRNLRKLYPFVQGLERYSGAIDVLSNGLSPYLPWIWAPIKLMLRITSDYLNAFDKLIDAYGRIAETMPRLRNLGDAFKNNPTLLTKLALYYAEVLEFHRRAYKFVRRKSWKFFFKTTWAGFDFRFNSILASMAKYSEAIDQEASTIDIIEAKQWREKLSSQVATQEKDRQERNRQSVIAWLALENLPQDDNREKLLRDCLEGSCDWVLKQEKVASWIKVDSQSPVVWLHGKPGAGKSVICASLIDLMQESSITTLFYFCKYYQADTSSKILKTLVLRIIESSPDLAAIAYTEFVQKYHEPSLKILRTMLTGSGDKQGLLHGIPACRIVVDGLDECDAKEQKYIVEDLLQLLSLNSKDCNCKLLMSSRDVPEIARAIRRKRRNIGVVSLSNENHSVNNTIRSFTECRLRDLAEEKESLQIGDKLVEEMVEIMINKAEGMFLWARLVLDSISDVDSVKELHAAITSMPSELPQLYARILEALCPTDRDGRRSKVMSILAWLVFARRPLKRHELLHGVSITPETPVLDKWNLLDGSVIDKCKPLVEELADGNIALIHFTVEEYLRTQRLDPDIWEEKIAFTCVTLLKDSLCLLDPKFPRINQLMRILSGSCALLLYAIDFWLDHVLVCASITRLTEESPLANALDLLEQHHKRLCSNLRPNSSSKASLSTIVSIDSRLEAVSHLSIYFLGVSILTFRAKCKDESANNGQEFEELVLERDSTLFSMLSQRFHQRVNQLLSGSSISNVISQDQLDCFRNQYTQFSFHCRFAPCTKASLGFDSETARASHEQLHVRRLFCNRPNCSRGRIGFRHQRELNVHERTYHEQGSILVPPRVRKALDSQTPTIEQRAIFYDGGSFSLEEIVDFASLATTQQAAVKYNLIAFNADAIDKALAKWRSSRLRSDDIALLLNEKLTSSLNVSLVHTFEHNSPVSCANISPNDRLVATGCNKLVRVFDTRTGEEKYTFDANPSKSPKLNYVRSIHFSGNGDFLTAGSEDGYVTFWCLQGFGRQVMAFKGHEGPIYALNVAADGYTTATGSNHTVKLWDLRDTTRSEAEMKFSIEISSEQVIDIAFSPDSRYIAISCRVSFVDIRSSETGGLLHRLKTHEDDIYNVRFSPDGQTLIGASGDSTVKTWDIAEIENKISLLPNKQLSLHRDFVFCSVMTLDGRWILSGSRDKTVLFWDAETGEPHLVMEGHTDTVLKLAIGHSSRIFVTAGMDSRARVWSYSG
ncbi:hypothetical protein F4678DRAFT_413747 [Xylaria arbuscula]|nr:hypothetical protein F4678DRAFT_413747 [Xylaria arbuscula]